MKFEIIQRVELNELEADALRKILGGFTTSEFWEKGLSKEQTILMTELYDCLIVEESS